MFLKKLNENLNISIENSGLEKANALQKKAIGKVKSGADVICIGKEKSGKTTAIVISVIQILKQAVDDVPRAIIIVPDREKADAMSEVFDTLGRHTNLRVFPINSKENIEKLRDRVYAGSDVIIGTAKLIVKLYSNNGINFNGLKMFIIDDGEASIKPELTSQIDRLSDIIPKSQRIIFASENKDGISRFAERYMNIPIRLNFIGKQSE